MPVLSVEVSKQRISASHYLHAKKIMLKKTIIIFFLLLLVFTKGYSQEIETLRQKIDSILNTKM